MDKYHTDIRLQLAAHGYAIIPNRGKLPAIAGWNATDYLATQLQFSTKGTTADKISRWPRRFPDAVSTGVRLENGLGSIDCDVDDPLADAWFEEIRSIAPEVAQRAPMRFGGGQRKFALFCQIEGEQWVRIASRRYNGHCVEIFGGKPLRSGKCSRQFGIYGAHSFNEDGSVAREYEWADDVPHLAMLPVADQPRLTIKQAYALVDAFEQLARNAGWEAEKTPNTTASGAIYDIDETTRFDTDTGGDGLTYAELCDAQAAYGDLRCASNFIRGRDGVNRTRCWVFFSKRHDCTAVFVYGDEQTHYPKDMDPAAKAADLAAGLEALAQAPSHNPDPQAPPRPDDKASLFEKAAWLLQTHAYCAQTDTVVELHKAADDCHISPTAFARLYRAWREQVIGKLGGITHAYATGQWEVHRTRIDVEGVRMRPDQPFPLYAEDGRRFKNTYLHPRHDATGGDVSPFVAFMEHLLPAPVERDWFCDWLAHKHRCPGVPGVAVVMVAAGPDGPVYGAGRGILRDIIARLLGPRYVKPIDFDVFTGRSAQGVYTDWGAYATLVTVNEAKDTPDSGAWTTRRAVYERLREIVDPRAIERTFTVKGKPAFSGLSFASYLVFSNNRDALQIPEGDRRVVALANGARMSPDMAASLTAWMADPASIAALARWLEQRDLAGFDVYAPLETQTKADMQELARSELDEAFAKVRKVIGPKRLFTGAMVRSAVLIEMGDGAPSEDVRRWVGKRLRSEATQVGHYHTATAQGHHKILQWRGTDCSWVAHGEMARGSVAQSAAAITRHYDGSVAGGDPVAGRES